MARPRQFDIDEALDRAMEAFWEHGYEATSMSDLMEAMGLNKGSIYKVWDDKHALFMASLERYMNAMFDTVRQAMTRASSPMDGVRGWLAQAREWGKDGTMRKGCLGINSMAELGPHDADVRKLMKSHFKRMEALLTDVITQGQQMQQFRDDVPANRLAHFLVVFAAGSMVITKGSFQELDRDNLTDVALAALTGK